MAKLYRKDIPAACGYCRFSMVGANHLLICKKRGPVQAEQCCRKYSYDPFKREPKAAPLISGNFTNDDFIL